MSLFIKNLVEAMQCEVNRNCVSPTGIVHSVQEAGTEGKRTYCNHRYPYGNWADGHFHKWDSTDKPVTCKRCLAMMHPDKDKLLGDIIENTEQWSTFSSKCSYHGDIVDKERTCHLNSTPNEHEWGKRNPCKPNICSRIETFLNTAKGLTKKRIKK